jgi:hypothetical protein
MFPDLNVCGNIHDLQIKFQKVFLQITEFGLRCIAECFLYQYEICLDVGRHYFKQLLLISGYVKWAY